MGRHKPARNGAREHRDSAEWSDQAAAQLRDLEDAIDYLFNVVVTTGMRKRPIIANVDTEFLDYFGASDGRGLDHFNIVYGSMTTKAGKTYLRVAEEYDPHRRYGSYTTSAPYGKYWVLLAHAFRAVNNTDIHGIIR
jgi:hypothetical protein